MELFGRGGTILILVALVIFGSKRLPDAAKSLGKSIRIFKSELEHKSSDNSEESDKPEGQ
jgi:sec-independent protein translocase protein TatA